MFTIGIAIARTETRVGIRSLWQAPIGPLSAVLGGAERPFVVEHGQPRAVVSLMPTGGWDATRVSHRTHHRRGENLPVVRGQLSVINGELRVFGCARGFRVVN
jgi:hypothetical protein